VVAIPVSYFWFFSLQNRNVPGLEGWQLFSRFALGAAVGGVLVLLLSSWLNASMSGSSADERAMLADAGLDSLRYDTYLHLLLRRVAAVRTRGEQQ
jgi:hypothetical protein